MGSLSQREEDVLESLIQAYISTAEPVGSRFISKRYLPGMSPATIRNTMMDLEEMGYLYQPHTSAGREPTDKGYRYYVDSLMKREEPSQLEKRMIEEELRSNLEAKGAEDILEQVAKVIAQISHQIGIALSPRFEEGILYKLELVPLEEKRLLVVLTIKSGLVKTIVIKVESKLSRKKIAETSKLLNERLSGLSIREIRRSIQERLEYPLRGDLKLLKVFVDEADSLFQFDSPADLHLDGVTNIILQPEFTDRDKLTGLIELLDERDTIICLLNQRTKERDVAVTIGSENIPWQMKACSVVTSNYEIGGVWGSIGMIGPTRMRYSKYVPLIDYTAKLVSNLLSSC
ncbi:MAG TPA: heat-inducible transcription repressor HrcA [Candidatus Latescibacteria bacterium]|nr:heat-inducible transcription repressor HrcA [Candidatus Latescibacterota bacterium]